LTHRRHGYGARPPVKSTFANNGTWSKKGQDTLTTGMRRYNYFKQSFFDYITTVTTVAGKKQSLVRCKP
jgi:hypothetical protein